ncbi:beta-lactamase/transpeptidase-like protein [Aspergillus karnatakaensis]|uniref:serine hydrolase domain-containing protein n=1 Tax=Aspergillus karnatakaensis TaxID=1810916 RepID=UPI003CCCD2B3
MNGHASPHPALHRLEEALTNAVNDGTLPGIAVAASNATGSFRYSKPFGRDGCEPDAEPLTTSSMMAIASMTKLLTSIAVLQLVEKQLIALDDDVSSLLPCLGAQGVLVDWDAVGRPRIRTRKNPITLRQLLTHSSGAGYDFSNSTLAEYTLSQGRTINSGQTVDERFGYPLLFEPGTAWEYGTGLDWAGQLVERLTGESLESHMREYIWKPLGISEMTFWPRSGAGGGREHCRMSVRDETSGMPVPLEKPFLTEGVTECFGGQGVYASMEEFLLVLQSILADDQRLLTTESVALMFQPQLAAPSQRALSQQIRHSSTPSFIGVFDNSRRYDWGIGGMLAMEDEPSGRRKNTLFWSGKPNLFWFVDRERDLCGVFGTQFLPPCDQKALAVIELFEKSIYQATDNV